MWLEDYKEAIEMMEALLGPTCWMSISCSYDGSAFIFKANDNGSSWVWYRNTNVIEHHFSDTWRNPEHKSIFKVEKIT